MGNSPKTVIGVTRWVESPFRERNRSARGSTDSERVHKDHDLCASIEGSTKQEVVLAEPSRTVFAQVLLEDNASVKLLCTEVKEKLT